MKTIFIMLQAFFMTSLIAQFNFQSRETAVFFDLGETLVDTNNMSKPNEMPVRKTVRWLENAQAIVAHLVQRNYALGIITNVPRTWSIEDLKNFLAARWEQADQHFPWHFFEDRIQLPTMDIPAKPHRDIFQAAKRMIFRKNYIFVGEDQKEVRAACLAGYHGWLFKREQTLPVAFQGDMIPEENFLCHPETAEVI